MLSAFDKTCISEIAEFLPITVLLGLGTSLTNNCIAINTKEDAINALLLHEVSLRAFLSRKKITKDVLFKYLHFKEVHFPTNISKDMLIDLIMRYTSDHKSRSSEELVALGPEEAHAFGYQFTEWFYSRLNNNLNPENNEVLVLEDFWNDCQSSIVIYMSQNESQTSEASTAKETLLVLAHLTSQYSLLYLPNVSSGVKTVVEPHGLVLIAVCGTLHTISGNCVGVFEQMFGLIRNPMYANNFKIKRMSLILRSQNPEYCMIGC